MSDWRHSPERPQLPPAFTCSLAFWVASAAAYGACPKLSASVCLRSAIACASVTFVLAGILLAGAGMLQSTGLHAQASGDSAVSPKPFRKLALALMAATAAGLSISFAYSAYVLNVAEAQLSEAPRTLRVTLLEDCAEGTYLPRALCSAHLEGGGGINLIVDFEGGGMYRCGQDMLLEGRLARCGDSSLDYCWGKGTPLVFTATAAEVLERADAAGRLAAFRAAAIDTIGAQDEAHALLQALTCGYRANLTDTKLYAAFQSAGLAHMVAVSGAHLVIVCALFSSALKALRVPRRLSIAVLVFAMGAYTAMAGMPLSCIRAAAMSSVGILSLLGKRRPSSLNALGIVVIGVIAHAPYASVSASFALSALATMGIVVFGPLFEQVVEKAFRGRFASVAQSLSLSLSASFLAQWYASALFKTLPLISPVANVLCAPLLPACCATGLVAAVLGASGLPGAGPIIQLAAVMADLLIALVSLFAGVPYASVPVSIEPIAAIICAGCASVFLWIAWRRLLESAFLASCLGLAVAFSIAFLYAPQGDAVVMLDVGQGDSFLVTSEGRSVLIDTGNQDRKLLDQLARCRVTHLDYVVITHADDDHCGSIDALQRSVEVGTVLLAKGMLESDDERCRLLVSQARELGKEVIEIQARDVFTLGRFEVRVLWPERLEDDGGNADSIVMEFGYDGDGDGCEDLRALFTGDAERDQLAEIMEGNALGNIDILKVGHHGSRNAMDYEQAQMLDPEIALIGVGEHNRYGHPTEEVLEMLERIGCTVLRTDQDGGVRLMLDEGKVILHGL